MPLWFDLLRIPMAAPETRRLRRMRFAWQLLCLLTALCAGFVAPLRGVLGQAAPCLVAVLIMLTLIQSLIYWTAKQRADNAVLMSREPAE